MLKFHCHSCSESFRISLSKLYDKESIKCNNCAQSLPEQATAALRKLGESYLDVIDVLYTTGKHRKCWSLSVESDERIIPIPVSEYDDVPIIGDERESSYWSHRIIPTT